VCTAVLHNLVAVLWARNQRSISSPQERSCCLAKPRGWCIAT